MWSLVALMCLCGAFETATGADKTSTRPGVDLDPSLSISGSSSSSSTPSSPPTCPSDRRWSYIASRCCRVCDAGAGAVGACATYTLITAAGLRNHNLNNYNAGADADGDDDDEDESGTTVPSSSSSSSNNNKDNNNNNSNSSNSTNSKEADLPVVMVDGCEQCSPGRTFSATRTLDQPCLACSTCPKHAREVSACNATQDTGCACEGQFYLSRRSGGMRCELCVLCPAGWGVRSQCGGEANTECRKCQNGTYSDVLSADAPCRPCSVCTEEQRMLQECTATQDTFCHSKAMGLPPTYKFNNGRDNSNNRFDFDLARRYPSGDADHRQNPPPPIQEDEDGGMDVIPLYCAALGAVVVGLLAYVAFVHYRRMRDKRMSREPHEDVEYSKASGADSGVFADLENHHHHHHHPHSHQQKLQCAVVTGGTRLRDVPQNKRKELEKTLLAGSRGPADWKALARELGYNSGKISSFESRGVRDPGAPYRQVLADWSRLEGATVTAFLRALRCTGRHDVVKFLQAECGDQWTPLPQHVV